MSLRFRLAVPSEYKPLETLVIDSFEAITWLKSADEKFGLLNGLDWRQRWQLRFRGIFDTEMVLVGELDGGVVACATGTLEEETKLGYIDLLAVDRRFQGQGLGREMLRGMLKHLKAQGATHCHLECLTDNEVGNRLYASEGFQEASRSIRWFIKIP